ncbi:DNA-repair protein XRCC1 isoform X2 [Magnolia sinica]|uniref:DNA-repair protein XRCC1 isoform X2 n=1 Tax=Magnolia sinica TaxID=86752 RepID=UPI002659C780|nr:DNA-repair protein XRCC1 isoform X2 [Magnolia sinica]
MSDTELGSGDDKSGKQNLPSSMSSKEKGNSSRGKKHVDADRGEIASDTGGLDFLKLLEGVVVVLSGFVNPERGMLRSQVLEMGGEYRPDWTSDCTLLVCAFPNTPKFRQVEADCGTIVSKEWISECYNQKKLVAIESYLMHAGKPWRKDKSSNADQENSRPQKPHKQVEKRPHQKLIASAKPESGASNAIKMHLSPSKVKVWAIDDLSKTISWLESQEEKPEPSELKKIAAEGIIICLEDAIAALKENQDIHRVTEQWRFVPRVVEELARLEDARSSSGSLSKEELSEQAITCKRVYQMEYDNIDASPVKKKPETDEDNDKKKGIMSDDAGFDSDETIVMTEEEIDVACKDLASKHRE